MWASASKPIDYLNANVERDDGRSISYAEARNMVALRDTAIRRAAEPASSTQSTLSGGPAELESAAGVCWSSARAAVVRFTPWAFQDRRQGERVLREAEELRRWRAPQASRCRARCGWA